MPLAPKFNEIYTYKDYLSWDDGERWELIEGVPHNMTPAPMREHQKISMIISTQIDRYLSGKKCEVYAAPFDVRLPSGNEKDENINTVVQPDISVICDQKKLDDRGCKGAPDLIIEIISPSTASKDIKEKFALYEKHGVKEYWIILPNEQIVEIYFLRKKEYGKPLLYTFDDKITGKLFKDLVISLKELT